MLNCLYITLIVNENQHFWAKVTSITPVNYFFDYFLLTKGEQPACKQIESPHPFEPLLFAYSGFQERSGQLHIHVLFRGWGNLKMPSLAGILVEMVTHVSWLDAWGYLHISSLNSLEEILALDTGADPDV